MDLIMMLLIIIAGVCMGAGVHFIPVGGAPAAMSTATGVGTGTAMLAAGAGMTGLITAASLEGAGLGLILLAGAIGSMMMMGITMLFGNFIYVFGVGVVPSSGKVEKDPITGLPQAAYKTPGTEGHGVPTVSFVSGIIGSALGGIGGGMAFYAVQEMAKNSTLFAGNMPVIIGVAAICSIGLFFVNSVVASYNIGGTIEGFHDPKFKRIGNGALASIIASLVIAIFIALIVGGI
ncbi:MAG: tetrahydromethanopterin S-methyltransferase subunit D [Methanobrevibacter boviskoreani]|jgi:tetrahydromethanopterin S-methyltransferase subunit D|uniref:tetrahydromethanopterin S-methyltransferase subunit D n=1 Tax=Methanobrevibacter TaxID=2172 RepID=UPI00033487F1|nr:MULTISPECIES: tetrahydromethanopterin S-methyltransferase subunit D [Methanobrevibacter]AGN17393.1 tetrahydromethanopterin S-methyltransferase subunit D MtrD [Methanobrevibacter sp. AbM4]MDD6256787.1 tetrahydromethanopterin S-methyltransferase subunit D [Methanobrevibacter boviskoreani]